MVDWRDGAATAADAPDIHSANAMATSRKSSAISRRPTVMTNSERACTARISQR